MDPLLLPPWAQLMTWLGLAAFLVVSLARGWLITKHSHEEVTGQLAKRLEDRDALIVELRAQNVALDTRNDLLAGQVQQMVEAAHTSAAALQALPKAVGG